ncbi:TPA: hypothetical protein ACGCHU_004490, partial [Stenotrophomonas maltophilia]
STIAFSGSLNPLHALKPEHAYNYEVGYVHNLSALSDADGNYTRAGNPCLNGEVAAIPGVQPVFAGSDQVCNIGNSVQSQPVDGRNSRRRDHAWLPTFSATAHLSPAARAYVRYSEAVRFPSMF